MSQSRLTHSRKAEASGKNSRPLAIFREHSRSESFNRKFHAHAWSEPRDCIVLSEDEDESLVPVAAQVGLGLRIHWVGLGVLFWGSILGGLVALYIALCTATHCKLEDFKPMILSMLNPFILLLQRAGNSATSLTTMVKNACIRSLAWVEG